LPPVPSLGIINVGMSTSNEDAIPSEGGSFATTRWSVVLAAGGDTAGKADEALAILCRTYWYPLYAYLRHRGIDYHEAHDLTQAFFARLLEKNFLQTVQKDRGRFRSFLLVSLKHFLANEWDRQRAQKRGGGRAVISLDLEDAEHRYGLEPSHDMTPDMIFDRRWALILIDQALQRLRSELAAAGKTRLFERCKDFLTGAGDGSYQEAAAGLEMTEGAVKVMVHRMRRRFRDLLREQIAETVGDPAEIDEEIRHLISVLGGTSGKG
jgi:RNA polymerase sigma factor (sigma-70 family)